MDRRRDMEKRIAKIAQDVVEGRLGIVEGCRKLVQFEGRVDKNDAGLFGLILFVESESDDLPVGSERRLWSVDALRRKDEDASAYLREVTPDVLSACKALVDRFS